VTVDHVDPGTPLPIVAADFGSDSLSNSDRGAANRSSWAT
jgi:hypothetical protein